MLKPQKGISILHYDVFDVSEWAEHLLKVLLSELLRVISYEQSGSLMLPFLLKFTEGLLDIPLFLG